MKEKFKIGAYLLVLVLALVLLQQSYGLWQERELLIEQRGSLQQELSVTKQFAVAHKDYEAYAKRLQAERQKLERELSGRGSATECLKLVQRLAAEQGVQLTSVQNSQAEVEIGGKSSSMQLRLAATGDYFAALRWLRKLEREGVIISEMRVQKEKMSTQNLQLELLIKLHSVNL